MTFKELSIGQRFRQVNHRPDREWIKIEPVAATAHSSRYNAQSVDGQRTEQVGHSAKVVVPPYGDTTGAKRQKQRYDQLKALVLASGWKSLAELETAYLNKTVAVPGKPE